MASRIEAMNKARQHRRGCRYSDEFAPGRQSRRWTVYSASTDMTEREMLEAARSGDEDAFHHLVVPLRKAVTPTIRAPRTVSFPRFGPPTELAV
jgi:hypothetical protein